MKRKRAPSITDDHYENELFTIGSNWKNSNGWIGNVIHKVGSIPFYNAVKRGDYEFKVGEFVKVHLDGGSLQIAIIESLWQDDTLRDGSSREGFECQMAEVRWFYFPYEIKPVRLAVDAKDDELFETDHVDEVPVDTFESICSVTFVSPKRPIKEIDHYNYDNDDDDNNLYFYRYFYSPDARIARIAIPHQRRGMYSKRNPIAFSSLNQNIADLSLEDGKHLEKEEESSPFDIACRHLQLSAIPEMVQCRDKERKQIRDFLECAVSGKPSSPALYISGMPGTGKTATVHETIRKLQKLYDFQFVEINGMKLEKPEQAYTILYQSLTGKCCAPNVASERLKNYFLVHASSDRQKITIVLVDELDYMVTKKQTLIYNLFEWPFLSNSKLFVLAIANTMDLPERMIPRIQSRLGQARVIFNSYTRQEIETILKARLEGLQVFKPESIELCARKVASISGDIRRALQICRRAVEICKRKSSSSSLVTTIHIIEAEKELSSSVYVKAIKCCTLLQRLYLEAIIKTTHTTGQDEVAFHDVCNKFNDLVKGSSSLTSLGMSSINREDIKMLCKRLGDSGLIRLGQQRDEMEPRIMLAISEDDVQFALTLPTNEVERDRERIL